MKFSNSLLIILIFISLAVLGITVINTFVESRPVFDFVYFNEGKNPVWLISFSILIFIYHAFIIYYWKKSKQSLKEKDELFEITIHTVQDILQRSSARIQNIILDMEEHNLNPDLVNDVHECLTENVQLIRMLSSLNLFEIKKFYDKHQSSLILKTRKTKVE